MKTDDTTTVDVNEGSDDYIKAQIQKVAASTSLPYNDLTISITPADRSARHRYEQITVSVAYDLNKRVFIPLYRPGVTTRTSVVMLE
jgi:hypothetical protein